ncbi:ADP ribosylation factor protein 2 binding [Echinococcus multilocularis]|uniref:ADP-ribosylation factor-like protein 2-binding protein n=1 Tax=Echinococcus multilocularis TaxID=6211 RepID=A0A087VWX0_ECHMU|nr:ADP ribosylation factor protein 2 binding [Echinococcus multilocularis]
MEKNCVYFTDLGDNTSPLREIHKQYNNLMRNYIEQNLLEKASKLTLQGISDYIASQMSTCDGEVFELLNTLTNFGDFMELMVDFKNSKETIDSDLSLRNAFSCHAGVVDPAHFGDVSDP